jgi:hypothetical protein
MNAKEPETAASAPPPIDAQHPPAVGAALTAPLAAIKRLLRAVLG